tara:strand:+ start:7591 stop:8493 length:903 start_codon:yes stop_codon:yes gene_type:complete
MNIAFFTEMRFSGKVPNNHTNMRTEFAWMYALKADHYNYREVPSKTYDLGVVIIPKKDPYFEIDSIRKSCKQVAVMQEGPHWYFQDYSLDKQIWYFNTLTSADIIFTHNKSDKVYYQGLTGHKDVRVLQTLMIEETIGELKKEEREGVIIGGNFVNWYGGFDSYIVANEVTDKVTAPSMGRKQPQEEELVTHLPFMTWKAWIHSLNKFKIGVHLMRTHAAGTFALNCAYLGIPCIGYKGLDTQEVCHPLTTVEVGNIGKAKELIKKLDSDQEFYDFNSAAARASYYKHYSRETFLKNFKI